MKPKVYIETTIIGYLATSASMDVVTAARQRIAQDWWQRRRNPFELYCSEVVHDEAGEASVRLFTRPKKFLVSKPMEVLREIWRIKAKGG